MAIKKVMMALLLTSAAPISMAADLPESLKPPANEVASLQVKATGVQIYTCSVRKGDPNKYEADTYEWTLKAPEADLFDSRGQRIGKHYGGPTWESDDGSKVVGQLKARDNGPDANAIPWLLLTAKSNSGNGVFAKTTSIQRLDTSGGKAPSEGCDSRQAGKELRVPYTATYIFFSPK